MVSMQTTKRMPCTLYRLASLFTFPMCYRPSVCLSTVVGNARAPYSQVVDIFGNFSTAFDTLAIH